jgi:hypothetical protein
VKTQNHDKKISKIERDVYQGYFSTEKTFSLDKSRVGPKPKLKALTKSIRIISCHGQHF